MARSRGRKSILSLYARARKLGLSKGLSHDADDFASWLVCRYLEGYSQRQTLDLSLIDYLRATRGATSEKRNCRGADALLRKYRFIGRRDDEIDAAIREMAKASFERWAQTPDPLPEIDFASFLSGRDLEIINLYRDGLTLKEIGQKLGVTESRTSQLLRRCISILNNFAKQGGLVSSQLMNQEVAARYCGVSYQRFGDWIEAGYLSPAANTGIKMFRKDDLNKIRLLRTKFGREWTKHLGKEITVTSVPAEAKSQEFAPEPPASSVSSPTPQPEPMPRLTPIEDDLSQADRIQIVICQKLIARARGLDKDGKRDAAIEILWTVIEEIFEERSAA